MITVLAAPVAGEIARLRVLLSLHPDDVVIQRASLLSCFLGRRLTRGIVLPALIICHFLGVSALFFLDRLAQLAFAGLIDGLRNKLSAACLAHTVFGLAVSSEAAPFPVAALPPVVVVETHIEAARVSMHLFGMISYVFQLTLIGNNGICWDVSLFDFSVVFLFTLVSLLGVNQHDSCLIMQCPTTGTRLLLPIVVGLR